MKAEAALQLVTAQAVKPALPYAAQPEGIHGNTTTAPPSEEAGPVPSGSVFQFCHSPTPLDPKERACTEVTESVSSDSETIAQVCS